MWGGIAVAELPLDGVLVVELGSRIAVGAAGSLLAQLGATVVLVEPAAPPAVPDPAHKWSQRDLFAAGKLSRVGATADLLAAADMLLISSDVDGPVPDGAAPDSATIACDFTACGSSGPLAGQALSDEALQALCGLADTTGAADGPPLAIGAPVLEMSAALYGVAALLAALRTRRAGGPPQRIEVALYDVAVNALTTFLPSYFGGRTPTRVGNWHNLLGPWNIYRAADGWVLVCTASEAQWQRLCGVIERPELRGDARFGSLADRLQHRPALDAAIEAWTARRSVADCVRGIGAANIPCGPILRLADLAAEPNLTHRGMVRRLGGLLVPGSPFRTSAWSGRAPAAIPARDADRAAIAALIAARAPTGGATPAGRPAGRAGLPLAGLRVIEIGQYTTAPLAARYLLGFGAEVIRVEPPGGEPSRAWAPHQDGLSYFFAMFNGSKRAVALDLTAEPGRQALAELLGDADLLVENLKPGALARLGFDAARLAALNPRLIHCAISGFGVDSAYPERPAFDSVVQAMSGLMDATRSAGVPYKAGISVADIGGGQFALVALLAALLQRDRGGRGAAIDLSMQDAACWFAQAAWNGARGGPIADGAARTVAEVAEHPQTAARGLLYEARDRSGRRWRMLGPPVRLSDTKLVAPAPAEPLLDWATLRAELVGSAVA
jgi:crotonobetainyl-CoA:carnitine CoA-transferase CaiB-like acyl-CoA transferase